MIGFLFTGDHFITHTQSSCKYFAFSFSNYDWSTRFIFFTINILYHMAIICNHNESLRANSFSHRWLGISLFFGKKEQTVSPLEPQPDPQIICITTYFFPMPYFPLLSFILLLLTDYHCRWCCLRMTTIMPEEELSFSSTDTRTDNNRLTYMRSHYLISIETLWCDLTGVSSNIWGSRNAGRRQTLPLSGKILEESVYIFLIIVAVLVPQDIV